MPIDNKLMVAPDYISGLQLEWLSATSIRVKSGEAYVPAFQGLLELASDIDITGISLAAATWYYVYIFETPTNTGTASVEVSTTAPAVPYRGDARTKTADTSRRYLGALKSNAAGTALFKFMDSVAGFRLWLEDMNSAPFRVWQNTATPITTQTVDCSAVVPPTTQVAYLSGLAYVNAGGTGTGRAVFWGNSDMPVALSTTVFLEKLEVYDFSAQNLTCFFPLNSSRVMQLIANTATTFETQVKVRGYQEER